MVYGTGTLTATFTHGGLTGTGLVSFYDGFGASAPLLGSASLTTNVASIGTEMVPAGTHPVVASYAGDAKNAPATSGVYVLLVTPAQVTAIANGVSLLYGQSPPPLTGTLNNVLAQDAGKVTATFSTTATGISAPGAYPIAAALSGPSAGNYTVALGPGSGAVTIAKAAATVALTSTSQTPIFNTSIALTAAVATTTSGAPTGTVSFYDGATLLNATPAAIAGGKATAQLSALAVGAHSITAVYSGDANFLGITSSNTGINVLSPEFSVAASPVALTVLPLHSAAYTLTLAPVNATFVYPVTLSASGLPAGVTASFSPASIAVGTSTTTIVLTLSATSSALMQKDLHTLAAAALALVILPFAFDVRTRRSRRRRSRWGKVSIALLAVALLSTLAGCGGSGFFSHPSQTSTITITAVGGPVTHTTTIALTDCAIGEGMKKISICIAALLFSAFAASAQSQSHPVEIGFRYAAQVSNGPAGSCGCFALQGGGGDVAWSLMSRTESGDASLSLAFDGGSFHAGKVNGAPYGMTLTTFTAGPRLTFPGKRTRLFVQTLFGAVHGSGSQFPQNGTLVSSANSFAFDAGGGLDVRLKGHFALRILQADYLLSSLPNNTTNWQNNLRIGAGIALRFR